MRDEWMPLSAAALVTGAMTLVMSQFLAPPMSGGDVAALLHAAARNPGRWTAMGLLWVLSATGFILGLPCVVAAFRERGRVLGLLGCVVFAVGSIGLDGLAVLALVFRAMARHQMSAATVRAVLDDTTLRIVEYVWVFGLFLGFVILALAFLRARSMPVWVPLLLIAFVLVELVSDPLPLLQKGAYLALAVAFTAIAVNAVDPTRWRSREQRVLDEI